MPFQSKSQQRLFFAKESRGELPPGTAETWARETPDIKALPEHKRPEGSRADRADRADRRKYYGESHG